MSDRTLKLSRDDEGSLPLALLVVIVVAGLASVLVARVVAGERTVRFDSTFTRELHTADAGVAEALFLISGPHEPARTMAVGDIRILDVPEVVDGQEYDVEVAREGYREWRVTSVARQAGVASGDGPERKVVARILEQPLFFPGAFGDDLIALNGVSSHVDSYHSTDPDPYDASAVCSTTVDKCGWGTDPKFGTGNGTMGTNGVLDFDGGLTVRDGGAFLYDWKNNPGSGLDSDPPFGDRCDGNASVCNTTKVSTVLDPLEYDTLATMKFIDDKFDGGECDGDPNPAVNPRYDIPGRLPHDGSDVTKIGEKHNVEQWTAYPGVGHPDPAHEDFTNFYCALNLEILSHIELASSVTPDNPVVIFVKDGLTVPNPGTNVACHDLRGLSSGQCANTTTPIVTTWPRPLSERLQIYFAGRPANGISGSDIQIKSGSRLAAAVFAPRSGCGSTGGGGGAAVEIYGALLCRSMDNVGNWRFHFDDSLGDRGTSSFVIGSWNEE